MNRIFISSTCYDLIDLRAEIKEFIISLGLTPVLSDHPDTEFKTFQDQNSIETCLSNLRECDVVIVILSQRYGPSLKDAGFEDYSATHLEYKEAINKKIKTLVFVRDRLDADYSIFSKTKNSTALSWVKDKEVRLFEIIKQHKELLNESKNNWYWTFKDSIDLKQRLKIDLKGEIDSNRLNELINSGNCALLTVVSSATFSSDTLLLYMDLTIQNLGYQAAVEPTVLVFYTDSYTKVIQSNLDKSIEHLSNKLPSSLNPGDQIKTIDFDINPNKVPIINGKGKVVVEIIYRTIYGDLISDISEVKVSDIHYSANTSSTYKTKRYLSGSKYEKFIQS